MSSILVISNPISGDGNGREFVRCNVLPLLQHSNLEYRLEETTEAGAAGRLAFAFLHEHTPGTQVTVVVSGGDGTIHEVINGIAIPQQDGSSSQFDIPYIVRLVICPQGTANALYSTLFSGHDDISSIGYRLKSLRAFLDGSSRSLTLTRTQLLARDGAVAETVLGIVVTSTALHAAILQSAEHLRAAIPGIERFKVAATRHISTWYHSRLLLHPPTPNETVRIFDPVIKAFKPFDPTNKHCVNLNGPFAYFLSTVNVDRLEPDFEISPLFTKVPPGQSEMDLIVIRPLRDPSTENEGPETRTNFVNKTTKILQGAYNHGAHTTMSYGQDGSILAEGTGPVVVECFRCGGWEWEPDENYPTSHIVCVDGTIMTIDKGGKATCRAIPGDTNARFIVCA